MLVNWVAIAGGIAGAALAANGLCRREATRAALGTALFFYALTLDKFEPLLHADGREPITTADRAAGAVFSVLGGWALLMLVLATVIAQRTGVEDWRQPRFRVHAAWAFAAALSSVVAIQFVLSRHNWPPTTDFLNAYGDHWEIAVYQLIFTAWVGVPVGALGMLSWTHLKMKVPQPTRYVLTVGCAFGAMWSAWKLAGIFCRFVLERPISVESPVSVSLGVATLGTVVAGLIMLGTRRFVRPLTAPLVYRWQRHRADGAFYNSAEN